jgi:glycosyltransferase involved in cell wall biosynthesis
MDRIRLPRNQSQEPAQRTERSLRLCLLLDMAPKKHGSGEDWIIEVCAQARARGHEVDVFCRNPAMPEIVRGIEQTGARFGIVDELEKDAISAISRLRRYDVLQLNLFGTRDKLPLIAYAAWPARIVWVDHASGTAEQASFVKLAVRRVLDRLIARRIASIAAVSGYVRERNQARFGLPPDRLVVISNGVSLERFRPVVLPGKHERLRVLAVANLIRHKGIDVLLRALARMQRRDVELEIAGDGPEAAALKELASALGLTERVRFLGLRSDVQDLLARTDIFVHPATWAEAFGFTITEAMAAGVPVIATRTGGIPEIVVDAESGLLVPPGAVDELAAALDRLANDESLRDRLGQAARRRTEERFDVRTSARQHIAFCERVAGAASGTQAVSMQATARAAGPSPDVNPPPANPGQETPASTLGEKSASS